MISALWAQPHDFAFPDVDEAGNSVSCCDPGVEGARRPSVCLQGPQCSPGGVPYSLLSKSQVLDLC